MKRLDMIASMANAPSKMSRNEKEIVIQAIETKRLQTRSYFEDLEREIILKTKRGLNVINAYKDLADKLEKETLGWNGFIALIMATWLFTDCVIELCARQWISREQKESYSQNLRLELYKRIRSERWEIIRKENWTALTRHIYLIKNRNSSVGTMIMAAGIIALTCFKLRYPNENCILFEC